MKQGKVRRCTTWRHVAGGGGGCIVALILNLTTIWRWVLRYYTCTGLSTAWTVRQSRGSPTVMQGLSVISLNSETWALAVCIRYIISNLTTRHQLRRMFIVNNLGLSWENNQRQWMLMTRLCPFESTKPGLGAARSKAWVCGRSLAGTVGSNPAGSWISVTCECCVLSGRGLCVWLITRPEESYRVWCVCDGEASIMRRPWPTGGCYATERRTWTWLDGLRKDTKPVRLACFCRDSSQFAQYKWREK
jgi:hypothetical protein